MTYKIDKLFGSGTRISLLSKLMLNTKKAFYIRELAKELDIPYSVIYKEVKNLASLEVINEEKRGHVTFISINEELPYFSELKNLIIKTSGLSYVIKNGLADFDNIRYAFIYGSFAAGRESRQSDIDLLIIGNIDQNLLASKVNNMEKQLGRGINYILWEDRDFIKKAADRHYLLVDIASNPIIMLVGEESEFRRVVKQADYIQNKAK